MKHCKNGPMNTYITNGKEATVNKALDGSTYPGLKLVHSVFSKINMVNTTAQSWDWYCHLVGDRDSLNMFYSIARWT